MDVFTGNYKHIPPTRRGDTPYWRFNVWLEAAEGVKILSLGWRFQDDKLHSPAFKGEKGFFTPLRVSKEIAFMIYRDAIRKVGELEDREIRYDEKMAKSSTIGQSSIERALPELYAEMFGKPAIEGVSPEMGGACSKKEPCCLDDLTSPYPEKLSLQGMNNVKLRPRYIPEKVLFSAGSPALYWGADSWATYESSMAFENNC